MKTLIFTLIILGAIASGSFAQATAPSPSRGGSKWSMGLDAGLPVGNISPVYSTALGASVKFELPTSAFTFLTLSAGYEGMLISSEFKSLGYGPVDSYLPVKAGLKAYVSQGFFVEGQAGATMAISLDPYVYFVYAPAVGYTFNNGIEVGARYEGWVKEGTIAQATLCLAYRF